MKNQLSVNLLALMNAHQIGGVQLARAINIPLSTIKNIRKGVNVNPTIETLIPLARYFNVSLEDIIGANLLVEKIGSKRNSYSHSAPHVLPIISWEEAVIWPQSGSGNLQIFTEKACSEHSFALRSEPNALEIFPAPGVFLIDPMQKPMHCDYVLVHKFGLTRASIKQFICDDDFYYLKSLVIDSNLASLDKNYRLLGVIIEYRKCMKSLDDIKINEKVSTFLNEQVTELIP